MRANAAVVLALALGAPGAFGFGGGPPALRAGDPGALTCQEGCHSSFGLNAGSVTMELLDVGLAPFVRYEPGASYDLVFRVSSDEAGRARWGFELTALADMDAAGTFTPDSGARVLSALDRDYLTHFPALDGGSDGSWPFSWTAPPGDEGLLTFYACGNAADGDLTNLGDYIECGSFGVAPAAGSPDTDGDGLPDDDEIGVHGSDPNDLDTDDDGLRDDVEIRDLDTSALACDTDADGLPDGLEVGLTVPLSDPDGPIGPLLGTDLTVSCPGTGTAAFVPDAEPSSVTLPGEADSDGDGCADGEEDLDADGAVDFGAGETDPTDPDDCLTASVGRLAVLRLEAPLPELRAVFDAFPCRRLSDLRICGEAPGAHDVPVDDPSWPVVVSGRGTLVFIEYDLDTATLGDTDRIEVAKDPASPGDLLVTRR